MANSQTSETEEAEKSSIDLPREFRNVTWIMRGFKGLEKTLREHVGKTVLISYGERPEDDGSYEVATLEAGNNARLLDGRIIPINLESLSGILVPQNGNTIETSHQQYRKLVFSYSYLTREKVFAAANRDIVLVNKPAPESQIYVAGRLEQFGDGRYKLEGQELSPDSVSSMFIPESRVKPEFIRRVY